MYDLIIIGAGPGGIALAAEACASGINQSQILILEKGATHNSAIRQLYPDQKLTTANYKGFDARCEGLLDRDRYAVNSKNCLVVLAFSILSDEELH
jgi:thioredoxin reductase (NADPH)